jgi:hypothetical protein
VARRTEAAPVLARMDERTDATDGIEVTDSSPPGWANIIAHLHTTASNAEASELDQRIGSALRQIDGEDTTIAWSECFTTIEKLAGLLREDAGLRRPVHMLLVTDHMRTRSHRLPRTHLEAAAREDRIALGAELATSWRDVDGRAKRGPEILAYGRPDPVDGEAGPYFGLDNSLLEELYDTCLDREGGELDTLLARDLLLARGVAHALSHPFDGHALSIEGTFAAIGEFTFIESLNGGYYEESARVLHAFVALQNAIIEGAELPEVAMGGMTSRIVARMRRRGRPLFAWGGSDAHSHDFDRVVVSMAASDGRPPESLRPGDLFRAMLEIEGGTPAEAASATFVTVGRTATPLTRLADVLTIIARNVHRNRLYFRNPVTLGRILARTAAITRRELHAHTILQSRRRRELAEEFDPVTLLRLLDGPAEAERLRRAPLEGILPEVERAAAHALVPGARTSFPSPAQA